MTQKSVHQRYRNRISEEYQLLAEEKWIIQTLNKLKNQRNCLQIERLHLESMKAKIRTDTKKDSFKCPQIQMDAEASTSTVNLMQNSTGKSVVDYEDVAVILDDAICNEQELNLTVTNPVFNRNVDFNMEEDEDEDDDDDVMIDINMLMNGVFKDH